MSKKTKILLAEDDPNLGLLLKEYLFIKGYEVNLCEDGEVAWEFFNKGEYDFCILDVMMPNLDGFSLAKTMINKGVSYPFMFLTAKSLKADILQGYNIGAEDYILKPFDEEELLCKIKVILRRNESNSLASAPKKFKIGNFTFNADRQELSNKEGVHRLTEKESEVLQLLCINKNEILRREDAVLKIYGKKDYFLGRSFDVYIFLDSVNF